MPDPTPHKAYVDTEGNIILPELAVTEEVFSEEPVPAKPKEVVFNVIEEEKAPQSYELRTIWKQARHNTFAVTQSMIYEGAKQYKTSFQEAEQFVRTGKFSFAKSLKNLWRFLTQPVLIPRKNKQPKQYSRGTLFVLDIVRFGGTFAALFVALFVSLNYQSFWQIIQPKLDPLEQTASLNALSDSMDNKLRDKLLKSPSLPVAGELEGNLFNYLPPVGPPENRIIIPSLGLNIPLITPSYEALLREDWTKVEEDIQESLQQGVVHYPGTARPGQAGNFFVTGHSSYYPWAPGKYKTVFARLHELNVGDEYWVYYGGDKHRYVVRTKKEVKPSDVTVLDQPLSKRVATLMTCTPVGTTLRRLILQAEEVDPVSGIALEVGETVHTEVPKVDFETLSI